MYLNLYQKYILELLNEYGGLLERQLEMLVKHFKEPHLYNIEIGRASCRERVLTSV